MTVNIRSASASDLPAIALLAGELVRQHHAFDPHRFLLVDNVEQGYESWFRRELSNTQALVLVVESDALLVGYAYARLEPRDWNKLLDAHAAIHDLFIAEPARRLGLGRRLLEQTLLQLRERGARLVVLHTAPQNTPAQRLFAQAGFGTSMLELSRRLA